mmetsp:Transcript_25749/g.64659  ORF Transcript_25749/g.64659 Transcript_25749/m.64659 type:complete len:375 (-) Transcript_25749:77-1201(-)
MSAEDVPDLSGLKTKGTVSSVDLWRHGLTKTTAALRLGLDHLVTPTGQVVGGGRFSAGTKRTPTQARVHELARGFLFDMDGVLQRCGVAIPGAGDFIRYLRKKKIPFALLTNECRYTNEQLATKLNTLLELTSDEVILQPDQIYSAACSAGDFFKRLLRHHFRGSVYCIGEDGLQSALRDAYASVGSEAEQSVDGEAGPVPTVLCGADAFDAESMTPVEFVCIGSVHADNTRDIERAAEYVRSNAARVVYTCPDYFDIYSDGRLAFGMPMPVVELLERVLGCASYGLGKPNPHMVRMAADILLKRHHLDWTNVLFVGDSLNTDIRSAVENGISSVLVLSGTTSLEKLAKSAIRPDYVFESVHELHLALQEGDQE